MEKNIQEISTVYSYAIMLTNIYIYINISILLKTPERQLQSHYSVVQNILSTDLSLSNSYPNSKSSPAIIFFLYLLAYNTLLEKPSQPTILLYHRATTPRIRSIKDQCADINRLQSSSQVLFRSNQHGSPINSKTLTASSASLSQAPPLI